VDLRRPVEPALVLHGGDSAFRLVGRFLVEQLLLRRLVVR
jgi:hypothetical protein